VKILIESLSREDVIYYWQLAGCYLGLDYYVPDYERAAKLARSFMPKWLTWALILRLAYWEIGDLQLSRLSCLPLLLSNISAPSYSIMSKHISTLLSVYLYLKSILILVKGEITCFLYLVDVDDMPTVS
jgi:hypothetical protein